MLTLRSPRWLTGVLCSCMVTLHVGNVPLAHAELEVIVPAYFYPVPNSPWDDLNAATSQVKITAIMNPGSGPGLAQDSNYVAVVDSLRAAGGRVIGYVHTTWGARNLSTVLSEIDQYAAWYNVDGIFIDEMANTGPASRLNYYRDIYHHVKSIDANWEVVGNPGTDTLEPYLTWPTADQFVIFENPGSNYAADTTPTWVADYDRTNFAHLIHTEPSSATMLDDLTLAISRNAGSIYITNDVFNNPWDTLPSYWQAEIDAIERLNHALLAGDMDEDHDVDSDDLALWVAGFGIADSATHEDGDTNGDGDTDGRDFLTWQREFGSSSLIALASMTVAVPEPGSLWLLLTAVGFLFLPRVVV